MQLAIILIYFVLTVAIGVYSQRRSGTSSSFHGAGLGVLMCVAAGTGEWLGGTATTGVSEYGYEFGISGAWYTISNAFGVFILALFFAKLYRSLDTVTVPGIIGHFIGKNARLVASVLLIFVMIAVGASQVIAAGTLGVSILGWNFNLAVLILGLVFIVYTIAGGMNAVGATNMLHLIAMYGGVIVALIAVGMKVGGSSVLFTDLDPARYFNPASIGMPKVSSWIIASVLGACTAQAGIQPILAAKDVNVARKAAFITALIVAPFGILTAMLGMYAKIIFPDLANAKLALPTLMMSMHPVIGGIVLASIFAAILSTISPIILASGTIFTKDLYQRFAGDVDDRKLLFVSRLSTGISGLVCMGIAIMMYGTTKILDMVYFAYTIRGALFIVLLYGIYYKKTSETGAIISMLITGIVGLLWVVWKSFTGFYPIAPWMTETYAAVIAAAISTLLFSLGFPNKETLEQQSDL
jgi:SSS family solute:Na+ symporter